MSLAASVGGSATMSLSASANAIEPASIGSNAKIFPMIVDCESLRARDSPAK